MEGELWRITSKSRNIQKIKLKQQQTVLQRQKQPLTPTAKKNLIVTSIYL